MNKVLLLIGVTLVAQGFVYAAYPGSQTPPCSVHGMDQGYPGSQTPPSPQRTIPHSPTYFGGPGMSARDLMLEAIAQEAANKGARQAIATGQDAQLLEQGANRSDAAERKNA